MNSQQGFLESWPIDAAQLTGQRIRRSTLDRGEWRGALFAAGDALIILGSGFLCYQLLSSLPGFPRADAPLPQLQLFGLLVCYAMLTVICNAAHDLYWGTGLDPAQASRRTALKSFCLSSVLTVVVIFLVDDRTIPRLMVGATVLASMVGLLTFRHLARRRALKRIERGIGTQHVLILGTGQIGEAFKRYLETHLHLGKVFCGFVNPTESSDPYWLGTPEDLPRILREYFIDEIYCTPDVSRDLIMDLAVQAREERVSVKVVPDLYGGLALGAGMTYIGNVPVLELNHQPIPTGGLFLKRLIDVTSAMALLVGTTPVMLLAVMAIALDSQGPILYAAWRVGRKGRKFRCFKFRTMVPDADARKDDFRHMNERNGATFKIANDPRITRVGRILRKYSIDELPQLFNVLRGEMSIVGPRPHPVDDCSQYQLEDLRRLDVLPGITGLWQVSARRDPSFERNVSLDLEYIENWNVWLDVRILLRTVPEVFRGSGD
jgi:exopolysaccharide biosynthesis polyprenyl glycosylphosphotransferase